MNFSEALSPEPKIPSLNVRTAKCFDEYDQHEMAPELSSNWKRLQVALKKESTDRVDRKRKAVPFKGQQDTIAKRRRLEGQVHDDFLPAKRASSNRRILEKKSVDDSLDAKIGLAESKRMGNWGSTGAATQLQSAPPASMALWAEENDISEKDLAAAYGESFNEIALRGTERDRINGGLSNNVEIGKFLSLDCEMVGVGGDEDRSVLARASVVNFHGTQVYDSFVRPKEYVTDWRTHVSGVSPKNMATARSLEQVQQDIGAILSNKVLVGHAVKNDLQALDLSHPKRDIRDTSLFSGYRKYSAGRTPSLKKLAKEVLGVDIQQGEHSSIEDARITMLLFRRNKPAFDVEHAQRYPTHTPGRSAKAKPKKKQKSRR